MKGGRDDKAERLRRIRQVLLAYENCRLQVSIKAYDMGERWLDGAIGEAAIEAIEGIRQLMESGEE